MKALLLPIILLFTLVAPAKAVDRCGRLAEYYLEYANSDNDSTLFKPTLFLDYVSGFMDLDRADGGAYEVPQILDLDNTNPYRRIDAYHPKGSIRSLTFVENCCPEELSVTSIYENGLPSGVFDIPKGVTPEQLAHAVGKWLQAHPEKWRLPYRQCVHEALYATWPNT